MLSLTSFTNYQFCENLFVKKYEVQLNKQAVHLAWNHVIVWDRPDFKLKVSSAW